MSVYRIRPEMVRGLMGFCIAGPSIALRLGTWVFLMSAGRRERVQ